MRIQMQNERACTGLLVTIMVVAVGCGSSATGGSSAVLRSTSASHVLSASEAEHQLLRLPYHYRWRRVELPKGAEGALAGTATGKHRTVIHFGISLGTEAEAVPVQRAGVVTPYYYSRGGFVFNDDLEVPGKGENVHPGKQFHTAAQWDEATTMVVEMQEKLCKAATGEACPP